MRPTALKQLKCVKRFKMPTFVPEDLWLKTSENKFSKFYKRSKSFTLVLHA